MLLLLHPDFCAVDVLHCVLSNVLESRLEKIEGLSGRRDSWIDPKAVRAVGLANGANPISIIVPCHRVIGANGSLTGYGGGLPAKKALLALERGERTLL